ncbi:MAG TPA: DNA-protecting protein DprA [Candidatus Moranbacteria bacterium]|nr:DNA-protecting protein DprA [Candidatus Moranbacteria bacterium]
MKYLNALNKIEGVGSQKLALLMAHFDSSEKAWGAPLAELVKAGLSENLAGRIASERDRIDPDAEWEKLEKEEISVVSLEDPNYPELLREIHNPPYILYTKGDPSLLNSKMIAVVGSRKSTEYGSRVANSFGRDLANSGVTVVSGLALGIDAIAHAGALEAKGKTIAVMGNGLDNKSIHPRSNFELSQEIIRNGGLLLSEYPLGTSPLPGSFPARNRIMAGMSLGTLVVEAAEGSGSLITANLALDFNREVFAVPGPIFHLQSQGPHSLIKKGAKLVSSVSDILEEISFVSESKNATENPKKDGYRPATEEEKSVLDVLGQESVHVDTILKLSKLETATALSTLSMLEIKGIIKNMGGQNYIKL